MRYSSRQYVIIHAFDTSVEHVAFSSDFAYPRAPEQFATDNHQREDAVSKPREGKTHSQMPANSDNEDDSDPTTAFGFSNTLYKSLPIPPLPGAPPFPAIPKLD